MRAILVCAVALSSGCSRETDAQNAQSPPVRAQTATPEATPEERIARRIAAEAILRTALANLRTNRREDLTLPDLPLETRLAIPVSWNSNDDLVQTSIQIIDNGLEVVAIMAKSAEDIDRFIQVSAKYTDNSEVRALEIKNEISFNQLITAERAAQVIRAERAIRSKIGSKLDALQAQLAASIRQQLSGRSDLLKTFIDERPPSDDLKRSRAAVSSALDEARKTGG
jgi:hypothetical protein